MMAMARTVVVSLMGSGVWKTGESGVGSEPSVVKWIVARG